MPRQPNVPQSRSSPSFQSVILHYASIPRTTVPRCLPYSWEQTSHKHQPVSFNGPLKPCSLCCFLSRQRARASCMDLSSFLFSSFFAGLSLTPSGEGKERETYTLLCQKKKKKPTALQFPSSVKCPDRIPSVFHLPVSHLNEFQRGQAVPEEKKSK